MTHEHDFYLNNPHQFDSLPKGLGPATLRLWHYPAFAPRSVWSLHLHHGSAPSDASPYVLRRLREVPHPENPYLDGAETRPKAENLHPLLDRLHQIQLPPFPQPKSTHGRDGSIYGIAVGDTLDYSELRWWQEAPESWRPLINWFDEATAYFESILPLREP